MVLLYDPAKNPSIAATSLGSVNGGRTRAKDAAAKKAGLEKPAAILAKYPLPSPEVFVRDVAAIIPEPLPLPRASPRGGRCVRVALLGVLPF